MLKDIAGNIKDKEKIIKIFSKLLEQREKIEVKINDRVFYGLLNSIEKKSITVFIGKLPNKKFEGEVFFFFSGYLFNFVANIKPLEDGFFYFKIPDSIHFKRRDVRIDFSKFHYNDEDLKLIGELHKDEDSFEIGKLMDLSKNGLAFKPSIQLIDNKLKAGGRLYNLFFFIDNSNIIIEECIIRNVSSYKIGIEFLKIQNVFKKQISDFIINKLREQAKEEKKKLLKESFPEKHSSEKKDIKPIIYSASVNDNEVIKYDRILIFDIKDSIYNLIKDDYNVLYFNNPDQARVHIIKFAPHIFISSLYPVKRGLDSLKWLNMINEAKERNIPIMMVFEQLIEKEKVIKALKMFGGSDVLVRTIGLSKNDVVKRIDKLIQKFYITKEK